jgi:hypothetical protein
MDIGIYANLFEVSFDRTDLTVLKTDRQNLSDLRLLRKQFAEDGKDANVFAVDQVVYGYGSDSHLLAALGFEECTVSLPDVPKLTSRLILDSYIQNLRDAGYTAKFGRGSASAFQMATPIHRTSDGVRLFRGMDVQSMFLSDPVSEDLVFALSIKPTFKYVDTNGSSLRPEDIASQILKAMRIKQADLAPDGRINLEVSRHHLSSMIQPFVKARGQFKLLNIVTANLCPDPIRIVLSA